VGKRSGAREKKERFIERTPNQPGSGSYASTTNDFKNVGQSGKKKTQGRRVRAIVEQERGQRSRDSWKPDPHVKGFSVVHLAEKSKYKFTRGAGRERSCLNGERGTLCTRPGLEKSLPRKRPRRGRVKGIAVRSVWKRCRSRGERRRKGPTKKENRIVMRTPQIC